MISHLKASLVAAPVVLSCVLAGPGAAATLQCFEREVVMARLETVTAEVPRVAGLAAGGAVLEITVNAEGQWTAFFTYPDGYSCPFASGEGWRERPQPGDGPGT
jgi:hypothetical protein